MATFARILVAVDGSAHSEHALDVATEIAKKFGSALTLVAVVPLHVTYVPAPLPVPSFTEEEEQAYQAMLANFETKVKGAGISDVKSIRLQGIVVEELLKTAESQHPDLMVMGARGLSAGGRLFLGSVSDAIVHHVACPVLVVKDEK
jgi:nucleotide-binding universal stress UspA family protein